MTKELVLGFIFGISLSFISWLVAIILNSLLLKTSYYTRLHNFNFIKSKAINELIGLRYFKWIVRNSFFKLFNQKIKLENTKVDLSTIRYEMTLSEISHLIGFLFVTIFAIIKSLSVGPVFGLAIMIPNTLLNLYPSLLQQENKRRIDKLNDRARH
ncbi:glycosyl-4,4'-diaponeurosporenoate acyltransferase CrtO family protein [Roseivirga misakiensis]|uniref:Glycosyl-4,4'-diaponeurosporenoate acyltransferase n=1 Tax=Roseivirga misakiensis TaxID=1563681 RepID=A0A1E5T0I0_9BACT|nr:hypothetical protein [Roseivirga misakiensis]OEK04869.1 hypothetical protein BFP71_15635 [Roseivirga misakiensis]